MNREEERRRLTPAEREVVDRSHHPGIGALSLPELVETRRIVRGYRDKARDEAKRRRREARGKSDPRGRAPARDEPGMATKAAIFAGALKRLNREIERLTALGEEPSQAEIMREALRMRRAAARRTHPEAGHGGSGGMRLVESGRPTVTARPAEVGRVSQAVRVAQAVRDAR
jgi:hypothetical protein